MRGWGLARAAKWYLRGLLDAFTLALAALVLLGVYWGVETGSHTAVSTWLWFTLDTMLYPLYALQSIMHVAREDRVTVFELNLFASLEAVFAGRLVSVAVASTPLLLASFALTNLSLGMPITPYIVKLAYVLMAASVSMLVASRRVGFIVLTALLVLLPFSTPVLAGRAEATGATMDLATSLLLVATTPVYAWTRQRLLPMSYDALAALASAILVLVVLASLAVFRGRELSV